MGLKDIVQSVETASKRTGWRLLINPLGRHPVMLRETSVCKSFSILWGKWALLTWKNGKELRLQHIIVEGECMHRKNVYGNNSRLFIWDGSQVWNLDIDNSFLKKKILVYARSETGIPSNYLLLKSCRFFWLSTSVREWNRQGHKTFIERNVCGVKSRNLSPWVWSYMGKRISDFVGHGSLRFKIFRYIDNVYYF